MNLLSNDFIKTFYIAVGLNFVNLKFLKRNSDIKKQVYRILIEQCV